MPGVKVPIEPLRRFERCFECAEEIEPLPYLKDPDRLAFRPEGKGHTGGVPTLVEPRGHNFEADHDYLENVVWPALAHRFPKFERTKCRSTLPGLYDQNDLDGDVIGGAGAGGLLLGCSQNASTDTPHSPVRACVQERLLRLTSRCGFSHAAARLKRMPPCFGVAMPDFDFLRIRDSFQNHTSLQWHAILVDLASLVVQGRAPRASGAAQCKRPDGMTRPPTR